MCNWFQKLFQRPDSTAVTATTSVFNQFYVGVGINVYPGCPLNGCVNDVEDFFNYLVKTHGFVRGDNCRLLVNERATRLAILDRLEWLVSKAEKGAICVFQFSGHGTQVPNRNSDYEIDGMDEVICPVDFDWEGNWISDDQIADFADRIARKGALPIFLMDCCHSGTVLRDLTPKKAVKKYVSKFYPMPIDIAARITKDIVKRTVTSEINKDAVLISGCQDNQTSADAFINGRYNGALTYSLIKVLDGNSNITWEELLPLLRSYIKKAGYSQVPNVDASEVNLIKKVFRN